MRIPVAAPYDWTFLAGFLGARAIPGVEAVTPGRYARTVRLAGRPGRLTVEPDDAGACTCLAVALEHPDPDALLLARPRIEALFDTRADPAVIGAHLSRDPGLAPHVARRPGLRVPGAWDGFEMAVRAILGQQVSVGAATILAGRLVACFGEPLEDPGGTGLVRLFPGPEALAEADLAPVLRMPGARAAAIRGLAVAVLSDPDLLRPGTPLEEAVARLRGLRGIGEWTARYVALRALKEPDAWPAGDVGLMRALGAGRGRAGAAMLAARSAPWSPWRAYAALHLWTQDSLEVGIVEQAAG
ncbi:MULTISPECIES: DNA-3-methyladenine glycosylase family protein [Methylobacterium]|uniref:DNA-3-methyladenine glycosylase II n=2 Tax=Methylobacterium TaxID=407 RepID=A0ABQ4T207_9HYPH|nr:MULTISPECIES: AlkA N-terminal domain-containing protein [Methylobacterium]PIU04709.1 MAG: 3-methyladenine DNA glycosylase 2 [Methylobacterium sp. CG09_land_8_20_14_0_10_71_15]GBU15949.1 3-methyl-adenine DNA glycosylase II [Methylobacterium sp.]GJE08049.1 putative bifunctional transcriptional activator/DNA repair enzyme AlkA [Methylobacterium jeotgali]